MPDYWDPYPSYPGSDDVEGTQDEIIYYDDFDPSTEDMMEANTEYDEELGMSLSEYDPPDAVTPTNPASTSWPSYSTSTIAHGPYYAAATQDRVPEYHGQEPLDPSATPAGNWGDPEFPLMRADTLDTESSTQPYQGSVQGLSDSDSDNDRRWTRQRNTAQQYAAADSFVPPPFVGSRVGHELTPITGDRSDAGSGDVPKEPSKKKGKRGKDKDIFGGYDNSSGSQHRKKRRDDEERDPPRKQRSSKTTGP